jgi:hypothetical protein
VFIHTVRALEELFEMIVPDTQRDRQANRAPKTVPSADPVPELEHVRFVDTKGRDGFGIGAESDKVLRYMGLIAGSLEEPRSCGLGIRDGFLSRKRFTGDDEESSLRITFPQDLGDMRSVDVGNKVRFEVSLGVRLQSLRDHHRSKVRATDADIDDGSDGLSSITLPLPLRTASENSFIWLSTEPTSSTPASVKFVIVKVAQSDMEHCTVFGCVDVGSGEHGVSIFLDFGFPSKLEKRIEDRLSDEVLGEIDEHRHVWASTRLVVFREFGESLWVLSKQVLEDDL